MRLTDGELADVKRCPHCAVANPRLSCQWRSGVLPRGDGGRPMAWALYACASCGHAVLAQGAAGGEPQLAQQAEIVALFPKPRAVDDDIPETARRYLQQALETLHAPDAAAVMAASAVDAMLKDLGYREGSLYSRIDKAVEDSVLTNGMGQWAHSVRLEANRPRHADGENPHVSGTEAKQAVEFAEALGSFLFVLTKRVERGIQRAEAASNATMPKADAPTAGQVNPVGAAAGS